MGSAGRRDNDAGESVEVEGYGDDHPDCSNSPDDMPRSWRVRNDSVSGYLCHQYQSESSAEKECHCQNSCERNGIGTNCFIREPRLNHQKREEGHGEGNECDTKVEQESSHGVVEMSASWFNACVVAVCI